MTTALRNDADRRFSDVTLKFAVRAIESAFIQHHNQRAVGPLRIVISVLMAIIVLQGALEFYGTWVENWAYYDLFLQGAVYRGLGVAILAVALWVTTWPAAVRNGQAVVAGFIAVLYFIFITATDTHGLWIERVATLFNFFITVLLVATGLLYRYAAPIAFLTSLGFCPIIAQWMEVPWAPIFVLFATVAMLSWVAYATERARRVAWAASAALADEKALTERLLLSVLPPSIAGRMQAGETLIADSHDEATVVFADIANFTPLSATMSAEELVEILDEIFAAFDEIADRFDLEKIKTIGDAYMMAAGLPTERSADPAHALDAALAMQTRLAEIADRRGIDVAMRAGVHIGPVVAGVIGRSKFVYDLWGDSVNVASRMESSAPIGAVQVTDDVRLRLESDFAFEDRGQIDVKGKGRMRAWLVRGRKPG